jgi:hypothetical protein
MPMIAAGDAVRRFPPPHIYRGDLPEPLKARATPAAELDAQSDHAGYPASSHEMILGAAQPAGRSASSFYCCTGISSELRPVTLRGRARRRPGLLFYFTRDSWQLAIGDAERESKAIHAPMKRDTGRGWNQNLQLQLYRNHAISDSLTNRSNVLRCYSFLLLLHVG